MHDPAKECADRLYSRRAAISEQEIKDRRVAGARLFMAILFVASLVAGWRSDHISLWWVLVPASLFLVLAVVHDRVLASLDRARRAASFYQRCLERIENRWQGSGKTGAEFRNDKHPYVNDLDIFGEASLFQMLCTVRTRSGETVLAEWLSSPAKPSEARARQQAIGELGSMLELREEMFLLGQEVSEGTDPENLRSWGEAGPILENGPAVFLAPLISVLTTGSLLGWWLLGTGRYPFLVMLLIQTSFALLYRSRVRRVAGGVERPARELKLLSRLLEILENGQFSSRMMQELKRRLASSGQPPSVRIRQLARLIDLLNARHNQLFLPVSYLLLWTTQLAFAIERWRSVCGCSFAAWARVVGEMEALCALAGYSWEHPGDPFPELLDEGPVFHGAGLGHPLRPAGSFVRNSIELNRNAALLLVSGSNMSGKSTLLRTVGINAVMALAGAPVRAESLTISHLSIGATIRIQDSLVEGTSRFYKEITRLRQIVEIGDGGGDALFLLDEILHGTNSHDRALGAEAVIKGLLERGCIGLVTTHDLALARIADDLAPVAANVHFQDNLRDGRMVFDYLLRPGIVRRSNALELMRSVGLDV